MEILVYNRKIKYFTEQTANGRGWARDVEEEMNFVINESMDDYNYIYS